MSEKIQVERVGVRVGQEALSGIAGARPSVPQPCQSPLIKKGRAGFPSPPTQDFVMNDDQPDKRRDGNRHPPRRQNRGSPSKPCHHKPHREGRQTSPRNPNRFETVTVCLGPAVFAEFGVDHLWSRQRRRSCGGVLVVVHEWSRTLTRKTVKRALQRALERRAGQVLQRLTHRFFHLASLVPQVEESGQEVVAQRGLR